MCQRYLYSLFSFATRCLLSILFCTGFVPKKHESGEVMCFFCYCYISICTFHLFIVHLLTFVTRQDESNVRFFIHTQDILILALYSNCWIYHFFTSSALMCLLQTKKNRKVLLNNKVLLIIDKSIGHFGNYWYKASLLREK